MSFNTLKSKFYIRSAEVNLIRRFFASHSKVLELGGGNGWQAMQIASWGVEVRAIDVEPQFDLYHLVELYDGVNIPFPDENFDLVFSSNVLEHVEMRTMLFNDMKRVLKQGGYMIHIVPSASWRLWTSIAHYPYLVKRIAQAAFRFGSADITHEYVRHEIVDKPVVAIFDRLKKAIWPVPHGVDGSVLKELITFSRWGWRSCFRDADLSICVEYRTGIFYTGYRLIPWLGLGPRKFLAKLLGSSCHVFVIRNSSAFCH